MQESNQSKIAQFHKGMLASFSLSELRTLCLKILVNYDTLGGEELGGKVRELIIWMAHNGRLPDLQKAVEEQRPHVNWPDIRNAQLPSDWKAATGGTAVSIAGNAIGSAMGDGSVTAENIAGRDIVHNNLLLRKGVIIGAAVAVLVIVTLFFATSKLLTQPVDLVGTVTISEIKAPVEIILPTDTPTPVPSATSEPFNSAADGEVLIIILPFSVTASGSSEAHQLIYAAVEERRVELGLDDMRVEIEPYTILQLSEREAAQALGERYDAAVVIWGAESRTSVTVNFLNIKDPEIAAGDEQVQVIAPDTLVGAQFIEGYLPEHLAFLSFFAVGWALLAEGKFAEAIPIMVEAVANISDELIAEGLASPEAAASAYSSLGLLSYFYSRDLSGYSLEQAIAYYTKAIEIDPDSATSYISRGGAYQILGGSDNLEQAIADYTKAIGIDSDSAIGYVNRGSAYQILGGSDNLEQAIADYTKAIEIDPDDVAAYSNRGLTYQAFGDSDSIEKAVDDYTKAIEIDPDYAAAYFNLGSAYYDSDGLEQAIANYDKAIEINPDYAAAYYNMGIAYYDSDDLEQAIANYDKAIEINPDYAAAYSTRGLAYQAFGGSDDLEQAIADYDKAIEIDPDYAAAYNNRGLAYLAFGGSDNIEQAIANYTKAIEIDPDDAAAYSNRGLAYQAFGDSDNIEQAIADYTKALEIDPDYVIAYYNRGNAYQHSGDSDKLELTVADYTKALEIDPDFAIGYIARGVAYQLSGGTDNLEKAIVDYTKAIEIDPDYASAYINLGLAYQASSDLEQAIANFEIYLELVPNASNREALLNVIEQIKEELGQ